MTPPSEVATPAAEKCALRKGAPVHPTGDLLAWRTTVVFAPHPDDESLGCGGLIATLRDLGQAVHIVFVTDGSMSHPGSKKFPRDARIALRRNEALAAGRILEVPEPNLHFLQLPDGGVPPEGSPGYSAAVEAAGRILKVTEADTAVVPWRRDVHPDHLATWAICRSAAEAHPRPLRWIEYPVWMWQSGTLEDLPRRDEMIVWQLDIADRLQKKLRAIAAHQSQLTGLIDDDPGGFRLSEAMLGHFSHPTEVFFENAEKRNVSLPADYFDGVYRQSEDPWNFTTSNYEKEKYRATLAALPREHYASGLEIGCSIGVLTERLAARCGQLLAVDASEAPLLQARARLSGRPGVTFLKSVLPAEFPPGRFDLVVLSEVGYYWGRPDLERAIGLIGRAVAAAGTLILVHYTPYVPDYPLTGDEVHEAFIQQLQSFAHRKGERYDRYRIDVWQKLGRNG